MDVTRRGLLRTGGVATAMAAGGTFVAGRFVGEAGGSEPTALVAGSLLRLATRVPGASVEAHGSAAVRRLVVEGLRTPDAVALADSRLFDGVSGRATLLSLLEDFINHVQKKPDAEFKTMEAVANEFRAKN